MGYGAVIPRRRFAGRLGLHKRRLPFVRPRRNVRRRFAGRSRTRTNRKYGKKKTDIVGTYTKCKDWKPRRINKAKMKKSMRFADKVKKVMYSDTKSKREVNSFALNVGGINTNANGQNVASWFQFALDPLNTAPSGNGHALRLNSSARVAANAGGVEGLFQFATSYANPSTAALPGGMNPTISGICVDFTTLNSVQGATASSTNYRIGPSYMKYQMKNVQSYGGTLELYTVKPKNKIMNTSRGVAGESSMQGNQSVVGVTNTGTIPSNYSGDTTYQGTPLEAANLGLNRVTVTGSSSLTDQYHMNNNVMFSLTDAPDFNMHYKIVARCKVYVPPGGLVERSLYHKNGRTVQSEHIQQNIADRNTTYIIGKWVPEVVALDGIGLYAGVAKGDPGTSVAFDLAGVIHYRQTIKTFNITRPQTEEVFRVTMPSGVPFAGQAVSNYSTVQ